MYKTILSFIFLIFAGMSSLQAEPLPLSLRLKEGQKIKQTVSLDFSCYLEASEQFSDQIKKMHETQPTEETVLYMHALNQLTVDKPVFTGNVKTTVQSTILKDHGQYYTISTSSVGNKFSIQENLINQFSLAYDADNPKNNFSNLPFPIDFKQIDEAMKQTEAITSHVTKDGTVIAFDDLEQKISTQAKKNGLPSNQLAQISETIGSISQLTPQFKLPSYLTGIRLPNTLMKIGESLNQPYITIPDEIKASIPQEALPLLALLEQKITLIEKNGEYAKFSIEMPLTQPPAIPVSDNDQITFKGTLFKGNMTINVNTGLLVKSNLATDFSIIFSSKEESQGTMSDEITLRFVSRGQTETESGS